jgi:hypothetical protein
VLWGCVRARVDKAGVFVLIRGAELGVDWLQGEEGRGGCARWRALTTPGRSSSAVSPGRRTRTASAITSAALGRSPRLSSCGTAALAAHVDSVLWSSPTPRMLSASPWTST